MTHLYILIVLCVIVAASEWLVHRTRLRVAGSALLVIVLAALVANLGVLPTASTEARPVAVYDSLLAYGAPLAVFWLLLPVRLRDTLPALRPLLALFLVGVVAMAGGVMLGMWAVDGMATFGAAYDALGGLIVAAYTGGSADFGAVADGAPYDGAVAIDHAVVTLWLVMTLILPRLLLPVWPRKAFSGGRPVDAAAAMEAEAVRPMHLALGLALGLGAVWLAEHAAVQLSAWGVPVPALLVLVVLALVLARLQPVARLQGVQLLGTFAVYLYLAVLGARLDVAALAGLDASGVSLLVVVLIAVAVHGLGVFIGARWMRTDPMLAAVASQAGVGSAASALALARDRGRSDLLLPGVIAGLLGLVGGAYLGRWAAAYLLPLLEAGL